uniref:DUF4430 domain-containing protein n=1 Tax=Arion vulgaris TaxID=1028688 RepID=A0A0B6ZD38_9EUPU
MKMSTFQMLKICIVLVAFITDGSLGSERSGSETESASKDQQVYLCGLCGQDITIDLIIRNQYQKPNFEYQVTVNNKPQRELIYFLENAATMDPRFKFTADYYGSLGYMITVINGLGMNVTEKTFWEIIENTSGNSLDLGVSSYVPLDTQTILFNFTTWENKIWDTTTPHSK